VTEEPSRNSRLLRLHAERKAFSSPDFPVRE